MYKKILFLTGMYRSGTTLTARLLQSQKQVVCASDPIRPFFNFYRTFLQQEALIPDTNVTPSLSGLQDYFQDPFFPQYFQALVASSFHQTLPIHIKSSLLQAVKDRAQQFSPRFADQLSESSLKNVNSWSDSLQFFFELIYNTYNLSQKLQFPPLLAFKEVWSIEMALPLINCFSNDAKVIYILRDPKSIVASSKAKSGNYPLLYLARQWRKQLLLAKYIQNIYPDKILIVKYEDLCESPSIVVNTMVRFGLPPGNIIEPVDLIPIGDDFQPWTQNSSYSQTAQSFSINRTSIDQWKHVLSSVEEEWVEALCSLPENPYGYDNYLLPTSEYPKRNIKTVSPWLKEYAYILEHKNLSTELSAEHDRMNSLSTSAYSLLDLVQSLQLQV